MFLLEQNITKRRQMDENATQIEFKTNNDKKYKIKSIQNITVYKKRLGAGYLPGLYYLISWKTYPEEKYI